MKKYGICTLAFAVEYYIIQEVVGKYPVMPIWIKSMMMVIGCLPVLMGTHMAATDDKVPHIARLICKGVFWLTATVLILTAIMQIVMPIA